MLSLVLAGAVGGAVGVLGLLAAVVAVGTGFVTDVANTLFSWLPLIEMSGG